MSKNKKLEKKCTLLKDHISSLDIDFLDLAIEYRQHRRNNLMIHCLDKPVPNTPLNSDLLIAKDALICISNLDLSNLIVVRKDKEANNTHQLLLLVFKSKFDKFRVMKKKSKLPNVVFCLCRSKFSSTL